MSFEKVVLAKVADVVDAPKAFTCGTLFVECTAKEAAKIETKLFSTLRCGIIVSNVGKEFAFDFV